MGICCFTENKSKKHCYKRSRRSPSNSKGETIYFLSQVIGGYVDGADGVGSTQLLTAVPTKESSKQRSPITLYFPFLSLRCPWSCFRQSEGGVTQRGSSPSQARLIPALLLLLTDHCLSLNWIAASLSTATTTTTKMAA
mmetsp:Transcript_5442/g.9255  ORF Transcript_5442/g.9255 Transcript_5442/m.9255 type:complete len:139 (-) Transcript_5442:126-542(-)